MERVAIALANESGRILMCSAIDQPDLESIRMDEEFLLFDRPNGRTWNKVNSCWLVGRWSSSVDRLTDSWIFAPFWTSFFRAKSMGNHFTQCFCLFLVYMQIYKIDGLWDIRSQNCKAFRCLTYKCRRENYATIALPERRSLASTISQNSSEAMKRRNKPSSSAWSCHSKIISAAPLIFKTRATASWRLQSLGMGPMLSSLPSTPRPNRISSPSLKAMNPGPCFLATVGIARKQYLI